MDRKSIMSSWLAILFTLYFAGNVKDAKMLPVCTFTTTNNSIGAQFHSIDISTGVSSFTTITTSKQHCYKIKVKFVNNTSSRKKSDPKGSTI